MSMGDLLIYWTARTSALLYVVSIIQQLRLSRRLAGGVESRQFANESRRLTGRFAWSVGAMLLNLHVALALHFTYHWDHGAMVNAIARQTQDFIGLYWRGGAYINYTFMLVWSADAIAWWVLREKRYRQRPVWISMLVHGFLAFIAFNAVVVFGKGIVRWAGVAAFATVAWRAVQRTRAASPVLAQEQP
jgi:hypothetical protein